MSERFERVVPSPMPWTIAAGAILAQQVGSKAVRDGLFLSQVSAAALPRVMLLAALLAVPIVLGVSYAISKNGPGRVACALLLLSAALFGTEWLLLPIMPAVTAWVLYLHIATLGGTTISAFFSTVAEHFDPHSARKASSRILSGAAIGGLIGGVLVTLIVRHSGERALLLTLGAVNLISAFGILRISHSGDGEAVTPDTPASFVLTSLQKSAYLRSIAYLVLLTGLVSALLDFGFKNGAAQELGSGPELMQLFAVFHSVTALLTAVVQVTLAHRALERLGLSATLATLPGTILLGGAIGAALPKLWGQLLLRGASSVLESSLFRSAYEPLYTPLSQRTRRSTKTLIDVAAGRLGEAIGSGLLLALAFVPQRTGGRVLWLLIVLGAALCLQLSLKLHSGYVAALTASLRKGSVQLQAAEIADSTTRLTLSQTHAEISRVELLAQLAALRPPLAATSGSPPATAPPATAPPFSAQAPTASSQAALAQPTTTTTPASGVSSVPPASDLSPRMSLPHISPAEMIGNASLMHDAGELLSGERPRVLRVLEHGPLDTRLVGFAMPLLAHGALIEPVTASLRGIAEQIVGQLVDALHDQRLSLVARRRIPRILKSSNHPRAAQGLIEALRAPERELRHRAATALAELTERHPELAPESRVVHELVREELRASEEEPATLQHLFAILSLVLERDALWLARRALTHGDAMQRGTALEYLHTTLPEPLRTEFVSHLESGQIKTGPSLRVSRPPPA
jgi:AAA family ATP:ADP antiporter